MASVPLRVFVAHPSALLTDHRPHGDGLVAYGFLRELASRGHELHVAAQAVDLRDPPPAACTSTGWPRAAGRAASCASWPACGGCSAACSDAGPSTSCTSSTPWTSA